MSIAAIQVYATIHPVSVLLYELPAKYSAISYYHAQFLILTLDPKIILIYTSDYIPPRFNTFSEYPLLIKYQRFTMVIKTLHAFVSNTQSCQLPP